MANHIRGIDCTPTPPYWRWAPAHMQGGFLLHISMYCIVRTSTIHRYSQPQLLSIILFLVFLTWISKQSKAKQSKAKQSKWISYIYDTASVIYIYMYLLAYDLIKWKREQEKMKKRSDFDGCNPKPLTCKFHRGGCSTVAVKGIPADG